MLIHYQSHSLIAIIRIAVVDKSNENIAESEWIIEPFDAYVILGWGNSNHSCLSKINIHNF